VALLAATENDDAFVAFDAGLALPELVDLRGGAGAQREQRRQCGQRAHAGQQRAQAGAASCGSCVGDAVHRTPPCCARPCSCNQSFTSGKSLKLREKVAARSRMATSAAFCTPASTDWKVSLGDLP